MKQLILHQRYFERLAKKFNAYNIFTMSPRDLMHKNISLDSLNSQGKQIQQLIRRNISTITIANIMHSYIFFINIYSLNSSGELEYQRKIKLPNQYHNYWW